MYPLYVQKAFLLDGCNDCLQCCADDAVVLAWRSAAAARCEIGRDRNKSCASLSKCFSEYFKWYCDIIQKKSRICFARLVFYGSVYSWISPFWPCKPVSFWRGWMKKTSWPSNASATGRKQYEIENCIEECCCWVNFGVRLRCICRRPRRVERRLFSRVANAIPSGYLGF